MNTDFNNRRSRPRTPEAIQKLPNRQLAELIAVLETDLLARMRESQHPEQILRHRIYAISRAVVPLNQLQWCYSELLRRSTAGLLALDGGPHER
jgi:hypothetical protein